MSISIPSPNRIPMSQQEHDVLKIMHVVLANERSDNAPTADISTVAKMRPFLLLPDNGL